MSDGPDLVGVRAAVDAALERAAASGLRVSVAVVDRFGHDLAVVRADGATWFTAGIARAKARTAATFGRPSADLAGLQADHPEVFSLAADQLPFRPTTLPGGLPLLRDGSVVGAVGVSGASPEQDVRCAEAALAVLNPPSG